MIIRLAGGIILNDQQEMLLLHRNTPARQQWEIPGGKVEPGETTEQAALREISEELDIRAEIVVKLGEANFTEDAQNFHYTWFLMKTNNGVPSVQEPEKFDSLSFLPLPDLKKTDVLSASTKEFLRAYSAGDINFI